MPSVAGSLCGASGTLATTHPRNSSGRFSPSTPGLVPPTASNSRRCKRMSGYNAMVRRQAMEAACLGTYGPYKLQVTVNHSPDQWRYRIACTAIWGEGVGVPSFFILCAEYFIRHHRKLAVVRREIREEAQRLRSKK